MKGAISRACITPVGSGISIVPSLLAETSSGLIRPYRMFSGPEWGRRLFSHGPAIIAACRCAVAKSIAGGSGTGAAGK
jgi:hypothetical protein